MAPLPHRFETTAEAYLAVLKSRGIDWLFANAGTDFAPIIEALVRGRKTGIPMPEAVAIAHETTAVGMAHGYWLVTGRPQAVMVHVSVGTANALMGIINASRDQVPMLFTAGRTPWTEHGLHGSRDIPIHWGQEMFDQAGMLRELVKWEYELRRPEQVEAAVDRALAIASSAPGGPVHLQLPREALAEAWPSLAVSAEPTQRPPTAPHPDPAAIAEAARILSAAERPLIIAGGADPTAFGPLAAFAEQLEAPVVHFWPQRLAMPTTHPLHAGFDVSPMLEEADAILVLGVMVPWQPKRHKLAKGCRVIEIGPSPGFHHLPMRSFGADILIRSALGPALDALSSRIAPRDGRRAQVLAERHAADRRQAKEVAGRMPSGLATKEYVSRVLDEVKGDDAIVITEIGCEPEVMAFTRPDSLFEHPSSAGLGWGVPAALGAKLAAPNRPVIATVGDGSYMFANPVACHQTAEALKLPILTIVFNNGVWNAVRRSTRVLYPKGHAVAANEMPLSSLAPSPAFEKVVEASGGLGIAVEEPGELRGALERALAATRGGEQALLNVRCEIGS